MTLDIGNATRIYIRHKRNAGLETEGPAKESTVVVQDKNNSLHGVKDFENEIAKNEKDCKDLFELDYNPLNDTLFFNGRVPQMIHGHRIRELDDLFRNVFENIFHQFKFPEMPNNNYPDNYNGTVAEEVIIDGKKYLKKQHIINKTNEGSRISIMSTVYEPVEANNGTQIATDGQANTTQGAIINY